MVASQAEEGRAEALRRIAACRTAQAEKPISSRRAANRTRRRAAGGAVRAWLAAAVVFLGPCAEARAKPQREFMRRRAERSKMEATTHKRRADPT